MGITTRPLVHCYRYLAPSKLAPIVDQLLIDLDEFFHAIPPQEEYNVVMQWQ